MAGTINVDTLKADSNLRLQIASANVAFIDANGLTIVGNSLNVGGGRISVTSNSAIINPTITTPTVSGNLSLDATGTTGVRSPEANTLTFHTAGTEDMRINSVGGVQFNGSISVGGATPTTSGAGITFPATQSASTNANTLDDYEEGTFTPIAASSGGSITSYTSRGNYIKIGRQVTVSFSITLVTPGTASGSFTIGGLPFTTANQTERPGLGIVREDALTGNIYNCFLDQNGTGGQFQTLTGGGVPWTTSYNYTTVLTYIAAA